MTSLILGLSVVLSLAANPTTRSRCEKVFDIGVTQLRTDWAGATMANSALDLKNAREFRDLFLKECEFMASGDLDCAEGKGNPEGEAGCKSRPAAEQDACVAAVKAQSANPLACSRIAGAFDVAGRGFLARSVYKPLKTAARDQVVGQVWPKLGVDSFVSGCVKSAPASVKNRDAYCQCVTGRLQTQLTWSDFSELSTDERGRATPSAATVRTLESASSECLR
jgi:hypothetical protein